MSEAKYNSGLTRRQAMKLGLGAAVVAALSGTGNKAVFAADKKILKIAHPFVSPDWSPIRGGGDPYRWNSLWWASPMQFDADGKLQPYVVTSWEPSADLKTWTFKIDPNAKFSDGSQIVAADMKGSFEVCAMPSTKHLRIEQVLGGVEGYEAISGGGAKEISGIRAIDDGTLEIKLRSPDPVFHLRLASQLVPILSPSQARDDNGEEILDWYNPDNDPKVSGPFKPSSMNLDTGEIDFEPNENFWAGKPKLSGVQIRSVEDPVAATNLIKSGEYQAHTVIISSTLVQDLGKEFVQGPPIPRGQHFWFAFDRPPTDDPKVRQALILAIDRDGLMKASFPDGPGIKTDQLLVSVPGVDDKWEPYEFNPEKARQLLKESKYGGPERLPKLQMVGISTPAFKAAAQYIAEQWRQNLAITSFDMKPQADGYVGPDRSGIQIFRDDVATRVPDATVYLLGAIASSSSNAKNKLGNYKNDQVDALLAKAAQLPLDNPERDELARQAQRLFRDDYPFIPWLHEVMPRWARPEVTGIDKNLDWQVVAPWNIDLTS
jgi:peptide/nickel transport system substrate-binding protein